MFDCNLIKSREQKMRDILLPSLESTYQKTQMPRITPRPNPLMPPDFPVAPAAPAPSPAPPETELDFPASPVLPGAPAVSPGITVPQNPLLPPGSNVMDYEGLQYLNGYLRTQINKNVQVEFLVGSSNILTRNGTLVGVGLNYILLEDPVTGDVSACDFYNIKFCKSIAAL